MHTIHLRGADFSIIEHGKPVSHADFFADFTAVTRLGIVTPQGTAGIGATTMIMAAMTAFYDRYRATNRPFSRVYPDFYTFQNRDSLAHYTWLDIWPTHKDVTMPQSASARLDMIVDRAIHILLVPEAERGCRADDQSGLLASNHATDLVSIHGDQNTAVYLKPQLESAKRVIHTCYAYNASGAVKEADIEIACPHSLLENWVERIFELSVLADTADLQQAKDAWLKQQASHELLTQSYRQISLQDALLRI